MNEGRKKLTTPREILEAALVKEEAAYNFYESLLRNTKVAVIREILEQLREEEHKHIEMINQKLVEMDARG